jgi:RNA polymerase sigma-70 factor (ECF subfamily)
MLRVKAGEAGAFPALVERWIRPLASFFHRLGADPSLAEDCASEVFYKLYKTREAYEPRAKFSTFLFSVARHHWIDVYRHAHIGPTIVSGDGPAEEGGAGGTSSIASPRPTMRRPGAERAEVARAVREAVAALSDEHREVFALAQGEGLRYQEIAEILRIPIGTVKSRMHTAMALLRERLRRAGIEP